MPEEKKESFTFSDKIKNSKSAAPASFANRISSKIGSNGRPKKTLFERTKRDAPFFIAALVALLLLPFLYKYSGQVNEEAIIAPSSEDTIFDPERYGFDTAITDPDGEIAQLSGRDPLSLIKGWGSDEDSAETSYDYDRSGLEDSSSSYTSSPTTETTTNIYRRTAAPATRAAVRRSTTKIKEMGRAAMASAGGGLNITPWGGSLKGAAKKVGAPTPVTPPKPVSLQPLQAAGRPQRGYFGMGAGEQARRSAQALTKGDAMQALRDAQYAPIKPGRVGGLAAGESRIGGGPSDLKHGFGYKGILPWWWDLMKTRSQMEWEKRFNRKWDWIGWADKLAQNILGGLINCLITGEDDGAMGEMFGASGEGAQQEGCKCGKSMIGSVPASAPAGLSLKDWCKSKEAKEQYGCEWQGAKATGGGFWKTRADCIGFNLFGLADKGKASRKLVEVSGCYDFASTDVYTASFISNRKGDWNIYHYVVGVKSADIARYYKATENARADMLEVFYMDEGPVFRTKAQVYADKTGYVPLFIESVAFEKDLKSEVNADGTRSLDVTVKTKNEEGETVRESRSLPLKYNEFIGLLASGRNVSYATKSAVVKSEGMYPVTKAAMRTKPGKLGRDWLIGARCEFPLARITCEDNAMLKKDGNQIPYARVTLLNASGDKVTYNEIKDKFTIMYSVWDSAKAQFSKTFEGVTSVRHYEPADYTVERDTVKAKTTAARVGAETRGMELDVLATNIPKGQQPLRIRWFIRQVEGINEGKYAPGESLELHVSANAEQTRTEIGPGLPGTEVSIAECSYYDEVSINPPVPPTPEPPSEEEPEPEPKPTGGSKTARIELGFLIKAYANEFKCGGAKAPEGANVKYRMSTDGINANIEAATMRQLFVKYAFSCMECVESYTQILTNQLLKKAQQMHEQDPTIIVPTQQEVQEYIKQHSGEIPVAVFLQALLLDENPNFTIRGDSVCYLAHQVASWSVDPDVNDSRFENTFGTYAVYVSPTAAAFYPGRSIDENYTANPRFNKPGWNRGNDVYPSDIPYNNSLEARKRKYSAYPYSTNPEIVNRNSGHGGYPLRALANGKDSFPLGNSAAPAMYRGKYKTQYMPMFSGQCQSLSSVQVAKKDLQQYVNLVCTNGLQYKPDANPAKKFYNAGGVRSSQSMNQEASCNEIDCTPTK